MRERDNYLIEVKISDPTGNNIFKWKRGNLQAGIKITNSFIDSKLGIDTHEDETVGEILRKREDIYRGK